MVKERGIILGFGEGKRTNKGATWSGIGLRDIVVTPQNPCKDIGITADSDNFTQKTETFSREPLAEESLEKVPKVVTVDTEENIPPVFGYEVHYHKGE